MRVHLRPVPRVDQQDLFLPWTSRRGSWTSKTGGGQAQPREVAGWQGGGAAIANELRRVKKPCSGTEIGNVLQKNGKTARP